MPDVPPVEGPPSSSLDLDVNKQATAADTGDDHHDSDDDMDHFGGGGSPMGGHSSDNDSRPPSALDGPAMPEPSTSANDLDIGVDLPSTQLDLPQESNEHIANEEANQSNTDVPDQTTLLNNEEESFALAPVDASALKGNLNSRIYITCILMIIF